MSCPNKTPKNIRVLLLVFPWDVFLVPEPSKICFPRTKMADTCRLPETNKDIKTLLGWSRSGKCNHANPPILEPFHSNALPCLNLAARAEAPENRWLEDHSLCLLGAYFQGLVLLVLGEGSLQFCILGQPKDRWTVWIFCWAGPTYISNDPKPPGRFLD